MAAGSVQRRRAGDQRLHPPEIEHHPQGLDDLALGRASVARTAGERLDATRMVGLGAGREGVGRRGRQVVEKVGVVFFEAPHGLGHASHRIVLRSSVRKVTHYSGTDRGRAGSPRGFFYKRKVHSMASVGGTCRYCGSGSGYSRTPRALTATRWLPSRVRLSSLAATCSVVRSSSGTATPSSHQSKSNRSLYGGEMIALNDSRLNGVGSAGSMVRA